MLLSTPHLFSTFHDKFHFQSSAIFSGWWYLHAFCFGVSREKSKWDWHFWLNFSIIWANAVCAPKWWWVLSPRPCWAQKHGLWEMLAVTHVGCPGEMGHNQLLSCTADSSSLSWYPSWWDSVKTGVSGWEGLSLGCTSLDLGAPLVTGPPDDRTDVMKSYNRSEQSRVMKT